jgi:hypothetical protein
MPINYLKQIQLGEFSSNGYRLSPSETLESIIEGFYIFLRDPKDETQLIFNDGYPVLVFLTKANDSIEVIHEESIKKVDAAWASAGSIKNVYIKYNNTTDQIFIVRFHPRAFYRLFGLSASYFKQNPVAAFETIAIKNDFDLKAFFKQDLMEDRVAFIETYVQSSFVEVSPSRILTKTLEYIHNIKGNSTVRNVTEDAGVSYKWLERSFLKNIGLYRRSIFSFNASAVLIRN